MKLSLLTISPLQSDLIAYWPLDDTIENIANQAGIKWSELTFFNWGTIIPAEISQKLLDEMGCMVKGNPIEHEVFG